MVPCPTLTVRLFGAGCLLVLTRATLDLCVVHKQISTAVRDIFDSGGKAVTDRDCVANDRGVVVGIEWFSRIYMVKLILRLNCAAALRRDDTMETDDLSPRFPHQGYSAAVAYGPIVQS